MKSHELAVALNQLAKLLKSGPNIEIGKLNMFGDLTSTSRPEKGQIAVGLSTLLALSKFNKQEWINVINEYGFDISLNPRDSARDVLGKLLRYLEKNPNARRKIRDEAKKKQADSSPALEKALSILLCDDS